MTQQIINVGTTADDKTGDTLRAGFTKANANFSEIYTGPTITSATAQLVLNKSASGYGSQILGQTNGSNRWLISLGAGDAESGGNVGSTLGIYRYNDAGAYVDGPLTINRSNGTVTINSASCGTMNCNAGSMTGSYLHSTGSMQIDGNATTNNNLNGNQINTSYETVSGNMQVNNDVNSNTSHCAGYDCPSGQTACNTLYVSAGNWLYVSYLQSAAYGLIYNWVDGNQWSWRWIDSYGDGNTLAAALIADSVNYPVIGADSDERLKQGITPADYDCLGTLDRLPRHQFHRQTQPTPGQPQQVQAEATKHVPNGLLAQRVHEVAPHLARKGDTQLIGSHGHGNLLTPWNINTVNMLALLVGALQQLTARIEALEAGR